MALTPKQERFVAEYLIDLNATQAAIRAGYAAKHADVQGPRLLGNAGVAEAIAQGRAKLSEKVEITQEYVLRGLKREAEREGEGSTHGARVSALHHLGRTMGMFTDKVEHGATDGLVESLARAEKRVKG